MASTPRLVHRHRGRGRRHDVSMNRSRKPTISTSQRCEVLHPRLVLLAAGPACSESQHARRVSRLCVRALRQRRHVRPGLATTRTHPRCTVTAATLPVDEFDCPGKVKPLPTRLAKSRCRYPGRVQQVFVTLGDHVHNGQTLLTVDTPESSTLQSALRQARADVKQRQAGVAKADADLSRIRDLLEIGRSHRKTSLRGNVTRGSDRGPGASTRDGRRCHPPAAIAWRRCQHPGGLVTVRSPMDGEVIGAGGGSWRVSQRYRRPGYDRRRFSRVGSWLPFPRANSIAVQTDQRVIISLTAYPDQPFEGRVTRVAGALDPETRTGKVIAEFDNPRRLLRPEMFARVRYSGPLDLSLPFRLGRSCKTSGRRPSLSNAPAVSSSVSRSLWVRATMTPWLCQRSGGRRSRGRRGTMLLTGQ